MKRLLTAVLAASTVLAATVAGGAGGGAALAAAAPPAPVTGLTVTGTEVGMFPAFDPAITRYAVTTTAATGDVTVQVATEPGATVLVNGTSEPLGAATLSGLEAGDEISVLVDDASGTVAYSLVYLPADFPVLEAVTSGPVTPGHVLLTLGLWVVPGAPYFETAVDEHGVPAYVRATTGALDLKRLANGHYLVARGAAVGVGRGVDVVEMDETFTEVASYRTVGLVHTDGHDAILLPDGSHYLMAYEPDGNGNTDAIVQHISAAGAVMFAWNSADHMDIAAETVYPEPTGGADFDYAHINSFQVMADGDLLLSFRHTSSVLKVARTAHDGFEQGDVVWRLGGRDSDYTFADGTAGPCAQHTASELPNGDIMVFDNGSGSQTSPLCPDPADPSGPPTTRVPTRVAVFHLEPGSGVTPGVATTVRSIAKGGRHAIFAGSSEALAGDHVLVGWASNVDAVATEFDGDDQAIWELSDPNPDKAKRYFTYRATKAVVPDAIDPEVTVSVPSGGVVVQGSGATAKVSCTDRGGSTLRTCDITPIDAGTLGDHQVSVTATDGAGNTTTVVRDYTVVPAQPDAFVKLTGSRQLVGQGVYGGVSQQTLKTRLPRGKRKVVAVVKVRNDGAAPSRFGLAASKKGRGLAVTFTGLRGKTPRLDPGETYTLRVELRRTSRTVPGRTAVAQVRARSLRDDTVTDAVRVLVKVR